MKNIKKILASLTAMFMMLLCIGTVNVFAANDGSIEITNATVGKDYAAWKIFNATVNSDATGVQYKATSTQKTACGQNSPFEFTEIPGETGMYYVTAKSTATGESIAAFLTANDLYKTLAGTTVATATAQATSTTVKFTNLPYGYYYITSSLGSVVTIDSAAKDAKVIDKNQDGISEFDKKVVNGDHIYAVGDEITYSISFEATNYDGETPITSYTVTDTLNGDLIYVGEPTLKIGGQVITNTEGQNDKFTLAKGVKTFTYTINWGTVTQDGTASFNYLPSPNTVEITYKAKLTANAVAGVEQKNTANAKINGTGDGFTDEEKVYTCKVLIDKIGNNTSTTKLSGAEFVLKRINATTEADEYYKSTTNEGIKTVTWVTTIDAAEKFTTDDNGAAEITGLDDGTYYLVETKAPEGYNLMSDHKKVKVGDSTVSGETTTVNYSHTETISNNKGTALPSTGGMGTTLLYVVGGLLVAGAAIFFVTNKRMQKN